MTTQPDAATGTAGEAPTASPVAARTQAIAAVAGEMAAPRFPRGDLAQLRRLDPDRPDAPAFWRLLLHQVPEAERRSEAQENRWALVLHGLALMTQPGVPAHRRDGRIGQVLAEVRFSELRLNRLLRARGEAFRSQVPRVCRFLAAKGEAIDWVRFGRLLVAGEGGSEQEHLRREIARDYFRALRANSAAANDNA